MNKRSYSGMGAGYVSVMIIFTSICLTIFAVLSFRAAESNSAFDARSGDYLSQYYKADSEAKEILAQLDGIAADARSSGFFENAFEMSAEELDGVEISRVQSGYSVSYSVEINEKQTLAVNVTFLTNGGYEITRWQNSSVSSDNDDEHINVWDGSTL